MNGRTRVAVLGEDLAEFNQRLSELGKIFSIDQTSQCSAELHGASELIEVTFVSSVAQARECHFDAFIVLAHAHRHIDYENILTFLQAIPRSTIRH